LNSYYCRQPPFHALTTHDAPRLGTMNADYSSLVVRYPADANVRLGSKPVLTAPKRHFRSTPANGHRQTGPVGPVRATFGNHAFKGFFVACIPRAASHAPATLRSFERKWSDAEGPICQSAELSGLPSNAGICGQPFAAALTGRCRSPPFGRWCQSC
jgi:hypothetical protein